ncbi:hypothetical protein KIN20_024090 [Parelaphostrongylus tenuis]|uniref:Fungal lipase-type domain-containing protein n=1 Tax=Parelaphostrongylus tenuis TaxID=148309 RepID=A0AAD5MXT1_PARTN|nr:hypothetical protein KIN20_024090 [Parelaphostrongylus tenuis]
MKLYNGDRIRLVTFGQPRTGDVDFALAHKKQIAQSFRVAHSRDIVPHLPLEVIEHYYHHKSEVFYNNNMTTANYINCDDGGSSQCSDRRLEASINDHHRYYNVAISKWGRAGCTVNQANPPAS